MTFNPGDLVRWHGAGPFTVLRADKSFSSVSAPDGAERHLDNAALTPYTPEYEPSEWGTCAVDGRPHMETTERFGHPCTNWHPWGKPTHVHEYVERSEPLIGLNLAPQGTCDERRASHTLNDHLGECNFKPLYVKQEVCECGEVR